MPKVCDKFALERSTAVADAWKRFSQVFNLKDQKPITFVPKPQRNGRAVTDGCFVAWPKDSLILLGWEEGVVQVPGEKEKKEKTSKPP